MDTVTISSNLLVLIVAATWMLAVGITALFAWLSRDYPRSGFTAFTGVLSGCIFALALFFFVTALVTGYAAGVSG